MKTLWPPRRGRNQIGSRFGRLGLRLSLLSMALIAVLTAASAMIVIDIMDGFLFREMVKRGSAPAVSAATPSGYSLLAGDLLGPDHLVFSSARHEWLKALSARRPGFEVQAILGLFPEDPIDFSDPFFGTFNVRITRVSLDELRDVLARGIKVNAYTPDEPDEIAEVTAIGVTGIITDFPQRGGRP